MSIPTQNPFITAYVQSDPFGKAIFGALFVLSALSWTLIIYKLWQFWCIRKLSSQFSAQFHEKKEDPLNIQFARPMLTRIGEIPHPLFDVYRSVKQRALQILSKNPTTLTDTDFGIIESQIASTLSSSSKKLEKHLYLLPMIVTLAPFLGLLGTVWGILLTFSQIQAGYQASNTAMLSGLSMALATTVLGLLIAIPALIGNCYLRNAVKESRRDMEEFSHTLLSCIEMQYK